MIPSSFKMLYSKEQIAEQVAALGAEIDTWAAKIWEQSHTDVLVLPVLRGGIIFFSDLVRQVGRSVEISPVWSWAYDSKSDEHLENVRVKLDDVPAKGRAVLLVDDVCDTGSTLEALQQALMASGAQEVRSAVLIRRMLEEDTYHPDWVGMEYQGKEWFVGYGMDHAGRWRNLPDIHVIKQSE